MAGIEEAGRVGEQPPIRSSPGADGLMGVHEQLGRVIQSALSEELLGGNVGQLVNQSAEVLRQTVAAALERERQAWRQGLAQMQTEYRRNLPENWQDIEPSLLDVIEAVKQTGICLVWVPRAALVMRFVQTESRGAREALLVSQRDAVLNDLETMVEEAGTVDLAGFDAASAFARDAITTARNGHMTAAQSLAACGLEPAARVSFGIRSLNQMREVFGARDTRSVPGMLAKVTLLQLCTAKALAPYGEALPSPEGFNRHATQHGRRECFSDANALAALLLLVGWLREFRWFADHHPEAFRSRVAAVQVRAE
jgi:hypothetical protein